MSHGLHRWHEGTSDLEAWQALLPESGRFTHLTAAEVHRLWLPPLPEGLPVFAAMDRTGSRPQRRGLRVARYDHPGPVLDVDGLRVDSIAAALLACARDLELLDLVVMMDAALQLRRCTRQDLEAVAGPEGVRRGGVPRFRRALALADGRSESPFESLLRLLHVVCEIDVEPQFELRDEDGLLVARADLWVVGTNALHEYDGDKHLEKRRQRKDLARARRIGNQTWIRRGYTSAEVLHQAVAVLRDADLSLGRPHQPELVRAWHALLAESMFTPAGRHRLLRRLGCHDLGPTSGMGER